MIRYITAAPKTGSSYISGCIILMQAADFWLDTNYRMYPPWWSQTKGKDWDLRDGAGIMIANTDERLSPGGSIYKGHFWATQKNLGILESETNEYVVLLRSPADTLTAQFCSVRAQPKEAKYNPIYPIDHTKFDSIEGGLLSLINDGYLAHLLMWMADWIDNLDAEKGRLLLFESFVQDPIFSLTELAEWVGVVMKPELVKHAEGIRQFYYKPDEGIDTNVYPKGWTGKIDVFTHYFTKPCADAFEEVFSAMTLTHPGMAMLNNLYPAGLSWFPEKEFQEAAG